MAAETKICIKNVKPYDGEYELDFEQAFSGREWRWAKQLSLGEVTPVTYNLQDPDFLISIAVIAMYRSGKITKEQVLQVGDLLSDAPMDGEHIWLEIGEEVEDEIPPALTLEPENNSERSESSSEKTTNSESLQGGKSSSSDSAPWGATLEPTGASR